MEPSRQEVAEYFREKLDELEKEAKRFSASLYKLKDDPKVDEMECVEQSVLAMRHIEDARMRYGKVIQYLNGGESCYKK